MTRHTDGRAQVERAERMATAVQLRGEGLGYRAIAARLDCSLSTAHELVSEALAAVPAESVQQLRAVESDRLDQMHNALRSGIKSGDPAAVGVAVRVSARRAALYGLDAPVKVEVEPMFVRMHHALVPAVLQSGPIDEDGYVTMDPSLLDSPRPEQAAEPWAPEIVEADY